MQKSVKNLTKKALKESYKNKIRNRTIIKENSNISGKTIVNVDIQPEYASYFGFGFLTEWADFINEATKKNRIVFLYNGESLGMSSEQDYKMWLLDSTVDEEIIENAEFMDKSYAFFRVCMDEGVDENQIVNLIRFMIENNINDNGDLDKEMWELFIEKHGDKDIRDLLEHSSDMIYIPDLMDYLKQFNNIVLTVGGINECLKEVEIALMALGKPYSVLHDYTY